MASEEQSGSEAKRILLNLTISSQNENFYLENLPHPEEYKKMTEISLKVDDSNKITDKYNKRLRQYKIMQSICRK